MEEDCMEKCLEINAHSLNEVAENTESTQNVQDNPPYLWKCFKVTGITVRTEGTLGRFKTYWFPFIMHVALIINTSLLATAIITGNWDVKATLACASTNILSIASWHCMNRKRNKLKTTIHVICTETDLDAVTRNIGIKLVLVLLSAIPNIFAIVCSVYFRNSSDPSFWLYGYTNVSTYPHGVILLFANVNLYISLQVLFPGFCTCAYCFLCYALYKRFKKCESEMKATNSIASSKVLVSEYFSILSAAELLEDAFSVSVFLILLMHVLHMFSLLASLLAHENQFSIPIIGEAVLVVFTSVFTTVAIVIYASLIPKQGQSLSKKWKRSYEAMVLEGNPANSLVKLAAEREIVTMTACDIVVLQKRLILSIFGALITYGLLVIQIKKSE